VVEFELLVLGLVLLFVVNFFVNVPTVFPTRISISCPKGRMERRDEKLTKRRQRDARGSLFPLSIPIDTHALDNP
jgi:hypothetical protein